MSKQNTQQNGNKQFPKGYFINKWMGLGIAIFSGLGVPISIILNNFAFIGIGPAIGVSVGISIGAALEKKKEEQGLIRPLTESETKQRKIAFIVGILAVLAGLAVLLVLIV